MNTTFNCDVIVVGAGPSGISAAVTVARQGKKVVLVDRSAYPGSKNMYGGAVYHCALENVFKENVSSIPFERVINHHTWAFLDENSSFEMTFKNSKNTHAYAIKRFDLENWLIEIAKKEGVFYCPNTLVKDLILNQGAVVGIETEIEKYYAPITIIADGANSLLAKKLNLRKDFEPKDMLLSIKIAIKLDKKTIEDRFNLKPDCSNGATKMYFGTPKAHKNLFAMTFLYTFKDTIMLGFGANMEDLAKNKLNINEVLDEIKLHPDIAPLLEGGKIIEYSAHLIPEYGYKKIPKLTTQGAILVGDAAGFINGVHFEGTNFALVSGKLAGESALLALSNKDYSQNSLSIYKQKLDKTFIMADLYSYRNIMGELRKRTNSIEIYYPKKIKEFFEIITSANCVSKSAQFRKFFFSFFKDRNIFSLLKDIKSFSKCALDVFFGR